MPYNSKAFGNVIGQLRSEMGLSQEKLSGLAGISRSHLAMIENGRRTVRLDTLWKISEALEIRPSILVDMIEKELQRDN